MLDVDPFWYVVGTPPELCFAIGGLENLAALNHSARRNDGLVFLYQSNIGRAAASRLDMRFNSSSSCFANHGWPLNSVQRLSRFSCSKTQTPFVTRLPAVLWANRYAVAPQAKPACYCC